MLLATLFTLSDSLHHGGICAKWFVDVPASASVRGRVVSGRVCGNAVHILDARHETLHAQLFIACVRVHERLVKASTEVLRRSGGFRRSGYLFW